MIMSLLLVVATCIAKFDMSEAVVKKYCIEYFSHLRSNKKSNSKRLGGASREQNSSGNNSDSMEMKF